MFVAPIEDVRRAMAALKLRDTVGGGRTRRRETRNAERRTNIVDFVKPGADAYGLLAMSRSKWFQWVTLVSQH